MKSLLCIISAASLLLTFQLAGAQQPKKVFRIGYLSSLDPASESIRSEPILLALREFGYIPGQNIAIEYRYGERNPDRGRALAAELAHLKVDVILVAGGGRWVEPASNATKTIPIVMIGAGLDPVEAGLIKSLAQPGGNVTGITSLVRELSGKRLELLKDAVPKVTRVALLYDSTNQGSLREVKEVLPHEARALKIVLQPWQVKDAEGFKSVFDAINKRRPDAFYLHPSGPLIFAHVKQIAEFSLKSRLPSMFHRREAVEAGGLMYYGADLADSYKQVAWYVDKILKGTKPADLPVQQPMRFEFIINLQTAKKIGVTINTDVLARATKIIR